MKKIAIIPARGGSKRIPRKNIKLFLGKPIISYVIETALESQLFDEVMVSTDDDEIKKIALEHGANVPFLRSKENADDYASTAAVLIEVLEKYQARNQHFVDACCIYPTAVLTETTTLSKAFLHFKNGHFDSAFPVLAYSHPIQRALKFNSDNRIEVNEPQFSNTRSQDLTHFYHDAGQFYWFKVKSIFRHKKIWTDNTSAIPIPPLQAQDIDNIEDWNMAELKYQLRHQMTK